MNTVLLVGELWHKFMARNLVRKTLKGSGTFTVPQGVSKIRLITSPLRTVKLSGSSNNSIAIKSDGKVWCWGDAGGGSLGDNTVTAKSSPVQVVGPHAFIQVSGSRGGDHQAALKRDGQVFCWGTGTSGQLGDNSITSKSSPVAVVGNHKFIQVSVGNNFCAALKEDGSVWCWGTNGSGQLGDNTTTAKSSPVQVVGGHSFIRISAGNAQVCGLKADGTAWTWGDNTNGALGDNTTVAKSSPVAVVGGHSFSDVAGGASASFHALKANGEAWGWGSGGSGQLGDNTVVGKSSPVQVVGGHSFIQIGAGLLMALALKANGEVYAWGDGTNGNLGNNIDTANRSSPVIVAGGHTFCEVGSGYQHSLARRVDGLIFTWGSNGGGRLGDNTITSKSSPVQVVGNVFVPSSDDTNIGNNQVCTLNVSPATNLSYSTGAIPYFGPITFNSMVDTIVVEYIA